MTEWKPGTVAVATVRGVFNVQVVRCLAYDTPQWFCPLYQNGWWPNDEEVTDVRPLVVLDLGDADVKRLCSELRFAVTGGDKIADQIEQQTRPPKPAEPQGLGAVVEDAKGARWLRVDWGNPWSLAKPQERPDGSVRHGTHVTWDRVDAVRVLSEGVQS